MARILVVDDERDIVTLVKIILEKEGHEIVAAENGEKCMEILRTNKPDLILLDIRMPGESGWDICRKIKGDAETKDIPVVMFTVRGSQKSVEKSLVYAHADAHISKPFETKDLLEKIEKLTKK
ncbi:MAG: PleD family two-component system response regulator [Candidatus Hydrothermarchaeales archaeon]